MRVDTPEFESKSDLFVYLKANKSNIIAQKRQGVIFSESPSAAIHKINPTKDNATKQDGEGAQLQEPLQSTRVKVVMNTANWIDSHLDMLLPDAFEKSIQERKTIIPHLHDHIHRLDAKVGEVVDIFNANISLRELGLEREGMTQAVMFITDIMRSANEKVFEQYREGRINQHSVGLQYVKLDLAINDENSEKEFEFWNKHIEQAINPEMALEKGFFWVVQEAKLIEGSAVLFGSNVLTPTLDSDVGKSIQPPSGTEDKTESDLRSDSIQTVPGGTFGDLSNFKLS